MQYTWQLALVLVPVYFIKHSVSCYIYYLYDRVQSILNLLCTLYRVLLGVILHVVGTSCGGTAI